MKSASKVSGRVIGAGVAVALVGLAVAGVLVAGAHREQLEVAAQEATLPPLMRGPKVYPVEAVAPALPPVETPVVAEPAPAVDAAAISAAAAEEEKLATRAKLKKKAKRDAALLPPWLRPKSRGKNR